MFGAPGGICEAWFGIYGCLEPRVGYVRLGLVFGAPGGICEAWFRIYGCLEPRVGYMRPGLQT